MTKQELYLLQKRREANQLEIERLQKIDTDLMMEIEIGKVEHEIEKL
jgi:hypothetical protein